VLGRAGALPGVQAAAVSDRVPFSGSITGPVELSGRAAPEDASWALFTAVSPDFFQAMGLAMTQGRGLAPGALEADDVVVNEAFSRAFFSGEDPIGQRIRYLSSMDHPEGTISGVVSDIRHETLEDPQPEIYYPIMYPMVIPAPKVSIRTTQDPTALAASLRDVIHSIDPVLAIDRVYTMDTRISESIARERFHAVALAGFSAISLVITALGLYGLTAYTVSRRTREIGIRMALGASAARVRAATVGRTAGLALAGVALGLAGSALVTRVLETLLFGLSSTDPRIFAGVALVLVATAVLAAYAPARRAARVDPIVVLRTD
jgi:putative ABC transport system permease protein